MSYLDNVARAIQQQLDPEQLPAGDTALLFRLYAVLLLAKGTDVTEEDVHNAWAAWMLSTDPSHESIKPFAELSRSVQASDRPFTAAIRKAALSISSLLQS